MSEVVEVQEQETSTVLSIIERAASNQDVDIDKLERLLEMQERISNKESEQAFTREFAQAKLEMVPVIKNKKNDTTKSTYADLEIISLAIDPIMFAHGFTLSFGTADSPKEDHYRVVAELSHVEGATRNYQADIPIDNTGMKGTKNKTDTHGFGSSMSYGRRYLKCMIWDVALTDDDGNAA